jgi:hypothetical protein
LALEWPYVVLADQIVQYLAGSSGRQLNFEAGQTVALRLEPGTALTDYLLVTPRGQEPRRTVDTGEGVLAVPGTNELGQYRLQVGPEKGGLEKGFSLNAPREESRLAPLTSQQLDQLLGAGRYSLADDAKSLQRVVGQARVGREAFPLVMLLVVLVLAGEQWLANRFYREEG